MKVKAKPPHSLVAIFSSPKFPPDKSEIKMKGNINRRKIIIYFLEMCTHVACHFSALLTISYLKIQKLQYFEYFNGVFILKGPTYYPFT